MAVKTSLKLERSMTIREAIQLGVGVLEEAGISSPKGEVLFFLKRITGLSDLNLFLQEKPPLTRLEMDRFQKCLQRRISREPFQYILGDQPFWEGEMEVSQGVFIPRPETELLIQEALALPWKPTQILDLCTGCGCVAISLAQIFPDAEIDAVDLSKKALFQAKKNAMKAGLVSNVRFLEGDLFSPFRGSHLKKRFDFVVSNPPYVSSRDFWNLTPEIKNFEPPLALLGGEEGMDIIERILREAYSVLKIGGFLLMEVGEGQSYRVQQYLKKNSVGLIFEKAVQDLAGIDRVVCLKYSEKKSEAPIG